MTILERRNFNGCCSGTAKLVDPSRGLREFVLLEAGCRKNVLRFVTDGTGLPIDYSLHFEVAKSWLESLGIGNTPAELELDLKLVMGLGGTAIGYRKANPPQLAQIDGMADFIVSGDYRWAGYRIHDITLELGNTIISIDNKPYQIHGAQYDFRVYPLAEVLFSYRPDTGTSVEEHAFLAQVMQRTGLDELFNGMRELFGIREKCMVRLDGGVIEVQLQKSDGYVPQPGQGIGRTRVRAVSLGDSVVSANIIAGYDPTQNRSHAHMNTMHNSGGHVLSAVVEAGAEMLVVVPHSLYVFD